MNWTSEYPTQPGYYWIRNYTLQRYSCQEYIPGCGIVEVDSDLRGWLPGEDPLYFRKSLVSAEWFGPITPPEQENVHQ